MTLVLQGLAAARPRNGDNARWGAAILVAAIIHAAGAIGLWRWREPVAPLIAIPPATFIDLAPLPAPPVPPQALQSPEPPLEIPPDAAPPELVQPPEAIEPPEPIEPPAPVALPKPPPPKPKPHPVARVPVTPPAMPQAAQQEAAAPAATPTAATPVPVAPATSSALPSFSALVAAQLERNKRYPTMAQRRGEEGSALLRFSIDRSGNVVRAQIERSSGHTLLDDEVMALLRRAAPLPAPPSEIAGDTVTLIVPVSFSLRGRGD